MLTGLPRPDRWPEVRAAAFADLLDEAARLTSYAVADTGFSLEADPADPFGSTAPQRNEMTLTALAHADEVVVVGPPTRSAWPGWPAGWSSCATCCRASGRGWWSTGPGRRWAGATGRSAAWSRGS